MGTIGSVPSVKVHHAPGGGSSICFGDDSSAPPARAPVAAPVAVAPTSPQYEDSDNLVGWVNHDNFVELVGGILTNPVRVEDAEVTTPTANTLFGNVLVGLGLLELGDTHVSWLTVNA